MCLKKKHWHEYCWTVVCLTNIQRFTGPACQKSFPFPHPMTLGKPLVLESWGRTVWCSRLCKAEGVGGISGGRSQKVLGRVGFQASRHWSYNCLNNSDIYVGPWKEREKETEPVLNHWFVHTSPSPSLCRLQSLKWQFPPAPPHCSLHLTDERPLSGPIW